MVQICETVTAESTAALRAARDAVVSADLVELRLDGVRDVHVAAALADRKRPVVVTCRPTWEGGRFEGSEEERLRLLGEAVALGAEFVDLEWKAERPAWLGQLRGTGLVLSHHDHAGLPADLAARVRAMSAESPRLLKISVTATSLRDTIRLLDAVKDAGPRVAIAMGPAGRLTRCWPAKWGSAWTYSGTAAPGQTSTRELDEIYRVRSTTAQTTVYGVAGKPLGHSASPAMHNAAFKLLEMDALYLPFETDEAADLLATADALGVSGLSVTAPLKESTFERSAPADDESRRTRASNTLRRGSSGWESRNFDVAGFLDPLDSRGLAKPNERAVVLGAGGAARAVAFALVGRGLSVSISARRPERAQAVALQVGALVADWPPASGWDLLVNATPVGAWPATGALPIPAEAVRGGAVYDLVYTPARTALLERAEATGAQVIGGLEMLVAQASRQFAWWTGREAPRDVMMAAARSFVSERS